MTTTEGHEEAATHSVENFVKRLAWAVETEENCHAYDTKHDETLLLLI